jgi:serine protease AprX
MSRRLRHDVVWMRSARRLGVRSPFGNRLRTRAVKVAVLLLLALIGGASSFSQTPPSERLWIAFRDRGSATGRNLSSIDPSTLGISDRAIWRRSKVLPPGRLVDELDLPVDPAYINAVRATGARIRSVSRWFNAVSAELTAQQRTTVQSLPFVASIKPVAVFLRKEPKILPLQEQRPLLKLQATPSLDYGPSYTQLNAIRVVDVHQRGINGAGVIVGMLDDGFNYHQTHPALKNIKVIAEYDFIHQRQNTSRDSWEYPGQGDHGASTLSILGGFASGKLVGAAYGASFILAKTEIDSSGLLADFRIEEDLYVAGLEWEEQLGADVVSSSLGYNVFVDGSSYAYEDMNGLTATTSKAARIAARKGVLLVTAMGNEGNYRDLLTQTTGTLIAPADADSIVAVGAVSSDGILAGFSSTGPTSDGRIKPEVVAPGVNDYAVSGDTGYTPYFSGTSAATPLAAGVAALILSANPSLTPMEVRARMIATAQQISDGSSRTASYPNDFYGWGMVDASRAVGISQGDSSGQVPDQFVLHNNYPNPFNGTTTITVDAPAAQEIELTIYNTLGQRVRVLYRGNSAPGENQFVWYDGLDDFGRRVASGVYVYRLTTSSSTFSRTMLLIK